MTGAQGLGLWRLGRGFNGRGSFRQEHDWSSGPWASDWIIWRVGFWELTAVHERGEPVGLCVAVSTCRVAFLIL